MIQLPLRKTSGFYKLEPTLPIIMGPSQLKEARHVVNPAGKK
jgi:hypothetical protein